MVGGYFMRIDIMCKEYIARDKIKDLIEKKVARLEKFFDNDVTAKVVLSAKKDRYKMEITLKSAGKFVRSEVESDNMYANLDLCLSKLERQIIKFNRKLIDKDRRVELEYNFFDDLPEFVAPKIVKTKQYELEPISVDEAIEQLDLLGNNFYLFYNKHSNQINLIYKREDGNIGLIETKVSK